jgi:hypothetical protein
MTVARMRPEDVRFAITILSKIHLGHRDRGRDYLISHNPAGCIENVDDATLYLQRQSSATREIRL